MENMLTISAIAVVITLPFDSAFSQFSELHAVDLYFIGSNEENKNGYIPHSMAAFFPIII